MGLLLSPRANFPLAWQFQKTGAPLGEVFQFASGLYFRGKLAYARAFGRGPSGGSGALAIVPGRGMLDVEQTITADELRAMADVPVDVGDRRYREPLERDAELLARQLGNLGEAVLLGSIATGKYADIFLDALGERLLFPPSFVGRGDMSRGGLLLRSVRAGTELEYSPLRGAVRHGARPRACRATEPCRRGRPRRRTVSPRPSLRLPARGCRGGARCASLRRSRSRPARAPTGDRCASLFGGIPRSAQRAPRPRLARPRGERPDWRARSGALPPPARAGR